MTAKSGYIAVLMIFISSVTVASSSMESNVRDNSIEASLNFIRQNHPTETYGIEDAQLLNLNNIPNAGVSLVAPY